MRAVNPPRFEASLRVEAAFSSSRLNTLIGSTEDLIATARPSGGDSVRDDLFGRASIVDGVSRENRQGDDLRMSVDRLSFLAEGPSEDGQEGGIRTRGLPVPNRTLYQAEPLPDIPVA